MNKQTGIVALVGLVSGALGAFGVSLLSTPAEATESARGGKPSVVQLTTANLSGSPTNPATPLTGVLFRLWSTGEVDAVAFHAKPPTLNPWGETWSHLCDSEWNGYIPASLCLQSLGVIPDDPATPADVNGDGMVDAADLGIVLSDWSGKPSAR